MSRGRRLTTVVAVLAIFGLFAFIFMPNLFTGEEMGVACGADGDCRSGICLRADARGYCTARCSNDEDCSGGLRCGSLRTERACLKALDFGEDCFADGECRGGVCVAEGAARVGVCGQPCEGPDRSCPAGGRCEELALGAVCVPLSPGRAP